SNNWADNATAILDWSEGKFHLTFEGNKRVEISYEKDVIPALSKRQSEYSDLDRDIVYCFDWFFYYINLIEHYIRIKLIEFTDVEDIYMLYSKKIMRPDKLYETFMNNHSYTLAIDFWKCGRPRACGTKRKRLCFNRSGTERRRATSWRRPTSTG